MALELSISLGSNLPIFRQIVEQIRLAVATGKLSPGQQLPSVRTLAERLVVNPNTVAKAYGELAREGVIDSQQGRGVFVAEPRQIYTNAERLRRIEPLLQALVNESLVLGFSPSEVVELINQRFAKLQGEPP